MGAFEGTLTTPGTSSYTLPFGCVFKGLRCWAAGGRGADITYPTGTRGGGGGGGAYAEPTSLTTYDNRMWNARLTVVVGAGGSDLEVNGGDSYVTLELAEGTSFGFPITLARAAGGRGVANNSATGGSGGTVTTGTGYTGGNGASTVSTYGGGGGGGAGMSAKGGNASARTGGTAGAGSGGRGGYGSNVSGVAGTAGTAFGGGGGGGYRTTTGSASGGNGANGAVTVSIQWPDNIVMNVIKDDGVAVK